MDESGKAPSVEAKDIDHLGIVAGIVDEIGLVEEVDHRLGTHSQQRISSGEVLKAMIINGLGFVSAPMYLFEEFFVGKATEHLIREGIEPSHLNDDRLGRVLDKLYEADLSELFVAIASKAAARFGVSTESVALDATSFHLHGQYEADDEAEPEQISITHGYSRDHRPDLKQFVVDLMSTADGGVPVFMRVADGNEADRAVFAELLRDFRAQLDFDALFVADAALYGAENLASLGSLRWLCRVPATLSEARQALSRTPRAAFVQSEHHKGYRFAELESNYGGLAQRWLVVHSDELEKKASERLGRNLVEREKELERKLRRLSRQEFFCRQDAREAAEAFAAEHLDEHHRLTETHIEEVAYYGKRGRPAAGSTPRQLRYRIQTELIRDDAAIEAELEHSGRYLLATDVTDTQELTNEDMLSEYKARQRVERGFRFLKDPMFFTSSTFVNTPRRVAAIAMVMGLCLLVYALGERTLRTALAETGSSIRHQTGKPTQRPTLRWVFQMFQAMHVLDIDGIRQITNLTEERRSILGFLGPSCQRYYLLC
jgi:transposase